MQATMIAAFGQRIASLFRLLLMTTLFTLVGAVGISAWQTYGDTVRHATAERVVPRRAPSMSPRQDQAAAMAASSTSVMASAADGAGSTVSGETAQLLQSLARDVAAMGQDMAELKERVGRLASSQDAMARDVARIRQPNPRSDVRSAMAAVPPQSPTAAPDTRKPTSLLPPSIPRPH
jgi:hypothetical protein